MLSFLLSAVLHSSVNNKPEDYHNSKPSPDYGIVGGCIYLLYLVLFWVIMKINSTKGRSQPFAILAYT